MSEQEKSFKEWIADLERRRIRAVQMVLDGAKQKEVAKQFKVTTGAVCQWMMAYREKGWEGLEPIPRRGGPIIFTDEHKEKLKEIISRSPYSWGYETDLWTVQMARDVLHERGGRRFSITRVLSALHELGFSFQKPQVRALEKKTKRQSFG